jgi:predicted ATP-dependent serine protease
MTEPTWNPEIIPLIDHPAASQLNRQGIKLDLPLLTRSLEGFERGELVMITAPPGEGKTQLARTFTLNFVKQGLNVLWCSYESTLSQLRTLFYMSGLSELDNQRMVLVPKEHTESDINFIEKLMEENPSVDCLIVDDIHALTQQFIFGPRIADNMASYLRGLAEKLKRIAQKRNCIVITMAHIRKDAIKGKDNSLADIAYSAGLGQVADIVLAIRNTGNDMGTIEIIKSRWTGQKLKIKVKSQDKKFTELEEILTPAEVVKKFHD